MPKVASTCDESYQSRRVVLPTGLGVSGFLAILTKNRAELCTALPEFDAGLRISKGDMGDFGK